MVVGEFPAPVVSATPAQAKEKERKTEHGENKIVVKERDKGSKKESDWKVVKEITLMFKNNRKGRKK